MSGDSGASRAQFQANCADYMHDFKSSRQSVGEKNNFNKETSLWQYNSYLHGDLLFILRRQMLTYLRSRIVIVYAASIFSHRVLGARPAVMNCLTCELTNS